LPNKKPLAGFLLHKFTLGLIFAFFHFRILKRERDISGIYFELFVTKKEEYIERWVSLSPVFGSAW